jgi:putative hemolysin
LAWLEQLLGLSARRIAGVRPSEPTLLVATSFGATQGVLLGVVLVLFAATGVLALAETSLVRTSKARAMSLAEEDRRGAKHLLMIAKHPEAYLNSVLLLELLCQLLAATLLGVVSSDLFGAIGVLVATVFEVVVVFVLLEASPKTWAVRHLDRAALFTAPIVAWVVRIPPIRAISRGLTVLVTWLVGGTGNLAQPDVTESELLAMTDVAMAEDVIERDERTLIRSVLDFGDTLVKEVMVPRADVVAAEATDTVSEVLDRSTRAGFSRIPVHEGNIDDTLGVAYMKDLVTAEHEGHGADSVASFLRPAHFVPETKKVAPLMREMQAEHFHLAMVVDEYGGTAGIVTLEDLIEEIVGEIADEFDKEEPPVEPLGDGRFRVSGRMTVDDVNELCELHLPAGDWDTIGGMLYHLLGHVPGEGEAVTSGDYRVIAERVSRRRVERARIEPMNSTGALGSLGAEGL